MNQTNPINPLPANAIKIDFLFHNNPYGSLKEFTRREELFIDAQVKVFEKVGIKREHFEQIGHNLNRAMFFESGEIEYEKDPVMHAYLGERVFGDLLNRAFPMIYDTMDRTEFVQKEIQKKLLFYQPGQLFVLPNIEIPDNPTHLKAQILIRDKLSEEEQKECAQRALYLFNIFQFSQIHYRKLGESNPFKDFLFDAIALGNLLNPNAFATKCRTAKVAGYRRNSQISHIGLSIDDVLVPKDYVLTNYCYELQRDLIKVGDTVRYLPTSSTSGQLIDVC